jgi:2'-5' RNA ligase
MKTNRSLKEIMLPKTRFQDDKPYTPHITLVSVTTPTSPYHLNF